MTDNEFRDSWNFSKMVAINIGSVTLSKEDVLAIDGFINRQKAEIERLEAQNGVYETCNARKDEAIHHLEAEIEEYRNTVERVLKEVQEAKALWVKDMEKARADAIKEFAERLKKAVGGWIYDLWETDDTIDALADIDRLVKEFTEGKPDGDSM